MKIKHLIASFFAFLISFLASAQHQTNDIEVHITNIQSDDGTIIVGLYDNENTFYVNTYRSVTRKAKKDSLRIILKNIPYGEYAISLYHDKNDNKTLDTNFFKIPKEPYGTSNNAKGKLGPPKWEDAKFMVSEKKVVQSITL